MGLKQPVLTVYSIKATEHSGQDYSILQSHEKDIEQMNMSHYQGQKYITLTILNLFECIHTFVSLLVLNALEILRIHVHFVQ